MIQGILDVSEPLFLGTFLKVDGYVSWRGRWQELGIDPTPVCLVVFSSGDEMWCGRRRML